MRKSFASALFLFVFAVAALNAHVVVTPRESAPGAEQTYTISVPVEGTVASMSVELEVPAGLHVMQVASGEGFTFDVKKDKDRIVSITWKKEIKPKEPAAKFTFTAHNPQSGALPWKAHQTFADGSVRHWVASVEQRPLTESRDPASVTTIVVKGGAKPGRQRRNTITSTVSWQDTALLYRWLRDLHLYFGLFVSPFVLLFAASVFYLNHGKLRPGTPPPPETFQNLDIPDGFDRLKGREAVERAKAILPQVDVSGEIGFLRYVAKTRHLIFPVSMAGSRGDRRCRSRCAHCHGDAPAHEPLGIAGVPAQDAGATQRGDSRQLGRHRRCGAGLPTRRSICCCSFPSAACISGGRSKPSAASGSHCSRPALSRCSGSSLSSLHG